MKKIIIFTCLFWLHSVLLYAQQTDTTLVKTDTLPKYGTLKVIVLDSDTKETLPGVMVMLQGFSDTLNTDLEGQCTINNIVPGKYMIFSRMLGYRPLLTDKVNIEESCSTTVLVKLKATQVEALGMVDYPTMVQPDKTSSYHVYTAGEIKRYPSKP